MNRTDTLRLNGYAVDTQGRIACRAGVKARHFDPNSWRPIDQMNSDRFEQTWLAVIAFDVAQGDARSIVDALIVAADSPRALVGRKRNGSAVMLFKCPAGMIGTNRVEDYGTRGAVARFSLSILSEGATVDMSDYSWEKNRSPLDIEHDRLPTFTVEVPTLVTEAASAAGCNAWTLIERARADAEYNARLVARVASGELKIPTAQEEREAEEERLVAQYEGQRVSMWDGPLANDILRARKVVAARRAARAEAAP
jgi:hypothetical protein